MAETATAATSEKPLFVDLDVEIAAPPERVFEAMLDELGPSFRTPQNEAMNMKLEARPGGRWFRDLGNDQGHFWGNVQVIKQPTLLELTGPLFMSYAAVSHLQFKLAPAGEGETKLTLRHTAIGLIPDDHRKGVSTGWTTILGRVREHAERK
jgi:uncharacterized protein YndB with AHSA1/START domain